MLLYSILHLAGYDLTMEDLKNFRGWKRYVSFRGTSIGIDRFGLPRPARPCLASSASLPRTWRTRP